MRTVIVAAIASALLAGAAQAQEQTPENAQKFIAQIAGLGQITYTANAGGHDSFDRGWYEDNSGSQTVNRYFTKTIAPIWNVSSLSRCYTRFQFKQTWAMGLDIQVSDATGGVDWKNVAKVEVVGTNVTVSAPTQYGPYFHRFMLPNDALATRLGYAMEFLRVSCDATQGTGF